MTRKFSKVKLGKSPSASSLKVSNVMKANKRTDTKPERLMKKVLENVKLTGYKTNVSALPGSPDIVYPKYKIVIFVNGCFWHHCPRCYPNLPKTHTAFWNRKFIRNEERDIKRKLQLERMGWKVFIFWEHDINRNPNKLAMRVLKYAKSVQRDYPK